MKRIIVILTVLSMLLTTTAFALETNEESIEILFNEEKDFISTIGISGVDILDNEFLTRGEFVSLVINTFYPENIFDGEYEFTEVFSDVNSEHKYFSEIKSAKDMKIINGNLDNMFLPESTISYTDAIVILTNALGYSYLANANGGYPTGFFVAAQSIDLTRGLSEVSGSLTGDTASKLLYNALFVDTLDVTSIDKEGNIGVTIRPDENLLSDKYNIYKYDAKVVSTPLSALEGTASSMDTVIVKLNNNSKLALWSNNTGVENELGKKLTLYVKRNVDNGREEIVYYRDYKSMKVSVVSGDKIVNVTSNYVEYEPSSGEFKKIAKETHPDVLFNGVLQVKYDNDTLKPQDGFVTFIDADANGKAETISVMSFNYSGMSNGKAENSNPAYNIVVDSVDTEKMYISCRWNPRNNLDLDSDNAIFTVTSDDGTINSLSDILKDDVISVATAPDKLDGKDVYFLFVRRTVVNDIYDSYNSAENIITVNGTDYKVSSSLYSVKQGYYNNLVSGMDLTAYLDYTGKIAFLENVTKISNNYSYIISFAKRTVSGEETIVMKILENTNTVRTYNVSQNAKIDGVTCQGADAQETALKKRPDNYGKWLDSNQTPYETNISRPAIIKFNDKGEISSINTDNPDYITIPKKVSQGIISQGYERNIYTDFNSIGYSNEEVSDTNTLKAGFRAPRIGGYRVKSSTVEGRFYITSETYVFSVPDIDTCGINDFTNYASNPAYSYIAPSYDMIKLFEDEKEDSNYKVILSSSLEDGVLYDIQAYNVDADTGVAEMVVIRGKNGISGEEDADGKAIYLRKNTYYDQAKEKEMTKIYYTTDGENELSVIADTDDLFLPYDYIINGRTALAEDNIYDVEIPALKCGDIIRVTANGGYLSSIQRVVILDELETGTLSSFSYGRRATGYQASDATRRLFDVNKANFGGNASTFNHFLIVPEKVKGSIVHGIMSGSPDKKYFLNNVNYNDPSTYVSQIIDFKDMKPVLIRVIKDTNGNIKDVKTEAGDLNDIITIDEAGSFDMASRIIFRHTDFTVYDMIIINYEIEE